MTAMKRNKIIIFCTVFCLLASTGCKRYLDLAPKNQRTVTTTQDVKSLLANYLRSITTFGVAPKVGVTNLAVNPMCPVYANLLFEAYSDNIDFDIALSQTYLKPNNIHQSQEKVYADWLLWNDYNSPTRIWTEYYQIIGFLNALIDQMVEEIKDATAAERDQLLGEMYATRAYYFFKLLQYFGQYKNAALGIPVYLHSGKEVLSVNMSRKSHAEVYQTILDDLNNALQMAGRTQPLVGYNVLFNSRFLHHLTAQVYWFKAESPAKESGDYEQVKTHATLAAENTEGIIPLTGANIIAAQSGKLPGYPAVCMENNSQGGISAIYGSCFQYLAAFSPENIPLKEDFCNLFKAGDVRNAIYFNANPAVAGGKVGPEGKVLNWAWPSDGTTSGSVKRGNLALFKPEEAWLMLAEAQYRTNQTSEAIITLNTFKSFRNAGTADGLSGDALLQEIVDERRKEFFGDSDKRWLDLKRYGGKTITRTLRFFQKDYTLKAEPNDYHYALPIPLVEIQQNRNIVPNEGWIAIEY
jgi:hypothetical protein